MEQNQFEELFSDSFDTFRVFYNLTTQETGRSLPKAPKSIWQILNHLLVWQDHQLSRLQNPEEQAEPDEQMTWLREEQCDSQEKLDKAIATFYSQLESISKVISKLNLNDPELQKKLKIIQELSVHLSFHVGEVILMRRITGNYPLPHQMKAFLAQP